MQKLDESRKVKFGRGASKRAIFAGVVLHRKEGKVKYKKRNKKKV